MNGFETKSHLVTALRIALFLGLVLSGLAGVSFEPDHLIKMPINRLHPTQPNLGMVQVHSKAERLAKLDPETLESYLKVNPVPAVIGPHGQYYLSDRHHLTRALYEANIQYVYVKVIRQEPHLNEEAFWEMMEAQSLSYLKDEDGHQISHFQLSEQVDQMGDDPYRSLAAFVLKNGGYQKGGFFTEFAWAQFFRKKGLEFENSEAGIAKVLKKATDMAKSPIAARLPGFLGQRAFITCQGLLASMKSGHPDPGREGGGSSRSIIF